MANRKINATTKIRIMNNCAGSAGFHDINGKYVLFPKKGAIKKVNFEDLEALSQTAYKMLEYGEFIILDTDAITKLDLDYSNIIRWDEIDEFLDKKTADEIKSFLDKAPKNIQMSVALKAKENNLDSKNKTQAIKDATGLNIDELK